MFNNIYPHYIVSNDSNHAWHSAISIISQYGSSVKTEDNKLTKEILDLCIQVNNPLVGYPIKDSGWDITALDIYAKKLCEFTYDCHSFDYTYAERMSRQIYYITKILKEHPTSRRATAYLWLPEKDLETDLFSPCQVVADYKVRNGKLYATHFFRSHDIERAWVTNVYGLGKLQSKIASDLSVLPGSLTTISASAHIYLD